MTPLIYEVQNYRKNLNVQKKSYLCTCKYVLYRNISCYKPENKKYLIFIL